MGRPLSSFRIILHLARNFKLQFTNRGRSTRTAPGYWFYAAPSISTIQVALPRFSVTMATALPSFIAFLA